MNQLLQLSELWARRYLTNWLALLLTCYFCRAGTRVWSVWGNKSIAALLLLLLYYCFNLLVYLNFITLAISTYIASIPCLKSLCVEISKISLVRRVITKRLVIIVDYGVRSAVNAPDDIPRYLCYYSSHDFSVLGLFTGSTMFVDLIKVQYLPWRSIHMTQVIRYPK